MPTPAPTSTAATLTRLQALGARLREQRLQLGVSSTAAAAAAGVSRVTLHRIERGEPSVTIGAYFNVMDALGLQVVVDAAGPAPEVAERATAASSVPAQVPLAQYPQLRQLAWQLGAAQTLSAQEALAVYERNWRHLDPAALEAPERALIDALARAHGQGRLLV